LPESSDVLITQLQSDFITFFKTFYVAILHGIFAWAVISPPITYLLYKGILMMIIPMYKKNENKI